MRLFHWSFPITVPYKTLAVTEVKFSLLRFSSDVRLSHSPIFCHKVAIEDFAPVYCQKCTMIYTEKGTFLAYFVVGNWEIFQTLPLVGIWSSLNHKTYSSRLTQRIAFQHKSIESYENRPSTTLIDLYPFKLSVNRANTYPTKLMPVDRSTDIVNRSQQRIRLIRETVKGVSFITNNRDSQIQSNLAKPENCFQMTFIKLLILNSSCYISLIGI